MARFGRAFPIPRQYYDRSYQADKTSHTITLQSGFRVDAELGELTVVLTSESITGIIGVESSAGAGAGSVGIIEGAISVSVPVTGVAATGAVSTLAPLGDADDLWKNPAGRYPRRWWRKPEKFHDTYYPVGVEFTPLISNLQSYGEWWAVSTVTSDRVILRTEQTISSDYSIEGRP
jgi:hypothetical protein